MHQIITLYILNVMLYVPNESAREIMSSPHKDLAI